MGLGWGRVGCGWSVWSNKGLSVVQLGREERGERKEERKGRREKGRARRDKGRERREKVSPTMSCGCHIRFKGHFNII